MCTRVLGAQRGYLDFSFPGGQPEGPTNHGFPNSKRGAAHHLADFGVRNSKKDPYDFCWGIPQICDDDSILLKLIVENLNHATD